MIDNIISISQCQNYTNITVIFLYSQTKIITHNKRQQPMIRPPRPPSKSNKIYSGLQCVSADPASYSSNTRAKINDKYLNIFISKFSSIRSQEIQSINKISMKKTEDSQNNNYEQKFATVFISPRIQDQDQNRQQNGSRNGFHGFQIRNLSNQSRRSSLKQNRLINQTNAINSIKANEQQKQKNLNTNTVITNQTHARKHDKNKNKIQKSEHFVKFGKQVQLQSISTRAGILKIHKNSKNPHLYNENEHKTCIILPDSLLQHSLINQKGNIDQLLTLHTRLSLKKLGFALSTQYVGSVNQIKKNQQDYQQCMDYLIWNNQKHSCCVNICNLEKIRKDFDSFVVFCDANGYGQTIYTAGQHSKYLYFQVQSIQQATRFIDNLTYIQTKQETNELILHRLQQQQQQQQNTQNITQRILQNKIIKQRINMLKQKLQTQSHRHHSLPNCIPTHTPSASIQQPKPFTQIYRNKLAQLCKLLSASTQNKQRPPAITGYSQNYIYNSNSNQYLRIQVDKCSSSLMDCYYSTNTAYQLASELVRNNQLNYKQIIAFRQANKVNR